MKSNTQQETPITLSGIDIEKFWHFIYLGSILSKTGRIDDDIKARIAKARHAFAILKQIGETETFPCELNFEYLTTL